MTIVPEIGPGKDYARDVTGAGGETRGGSSPPFGTMLIIKGISVFRRSPFFRENVPSG